MNMVTLTRPGLHDLIGGVEEVLARGLGPRRTAFTVAGLMRDGLLPGPGVLTGAELEGPAGTYRSLVLHAQEGFSVVGVVWQPGAETVIHDHVAWCAFGVLSGNEHETLYRDMGDHLREIGAADNRPGEVSGFAPPGDLHKVRNTAAEVGVSIHVYGADLSVSGTSVRRVYDGRVIRP
jgi:3-mercaptopropionate dioxygenase